MLAWNDNNLRRLKVRATDHVCGCRVSLHTVSH